MDKYGYSQIYDIVPQYKKTEHYFNLIKWLIKITNCKKYLEVGVNHGENIYEIRYVVDKCVAVDTADRMPDKDGIEFNLMTSDVFFEKNTDTFDIIFIDGDHSYGQVKKDFENSLKILNKFGVIIFHDTDPIEEFLLGVNYCKDAYKVIDYIYVHHPELNVMNFPVHETGLCFIMRKNDRRLFDYLEK